MERFQVEQIIKKYLGIPYQHAGRDGKGLDCLGLVVSFYKDCGINIPENDGAGYSADWYKTDSDRFRRGIAVLGEEVPLDRLQPLDLVYFRMGRNITHCAIMLDQRHFLHVIENTAVHISPLNFRWRRRLAGARRLIESGHLFA